MQDKHFEWDDTKAADNWLKHDVTFKTAREAFRDPFAVEWIDRDQGAHEERFAMVAMVENRLMLVAYTLRGARTRIISARKPEPNERGKYHNKDRET
jgi:uncharacterized DUF497 family protein